MPRRTVRPGTLRSVNLLLLRSPAVANGGYRGDARNGGHHAVGHLPAIYGLVHPRYASDGRCQSWQGAYLRLQPYLWADAGPGDQRLPLFGRPGPGTALLDDCRLHLVVLDASGPAEDNGSSPLVGIGVGRDPDVRDAIRLVSLRRCKLALPALAADRALA